MDNPSTALVPAPHKNTGMMSYGDCKEFAEVAAKSRLFLNKDITSSEKALALIMIGREMGLGAAASIRGIYLINGVPSISSRVMASLINMSPNWRIKTLQWTDQVAEIQWLKLVGLEWVPQTPTSIFTMGEAKRAGLLDKKGPWHQWPKNMLWARALSNGFNIFCPELAHGMPIYAVAEEEVGRPKQSLSSLEKSPAGEDVPEAEFEPCRAPGAKPEAPDLNLQGNQVSTEQVSELETLAKQKGASLEAIRQHHKVTSLHDLSVTAFASIKKILEAK